MACSSTEKSALVLASPQMLVQVDQHGAALDAGLGHVLDAEALGFDAAHFGAAVAAIVTRHDVLAAAPAVVEHDLVDTVAIGIEHAADVG